MPVEMSIFHLPGGSPCLRMVTAGHFSRIDADAVLAKTNPGCEWHRLPQLVLTQQQTSISSEARRMFAARGELGEAEPWAAVVVASPIVRVTTNFLVRLNRNRKVRMFSDELEALRWLDERIREETAQAHST